MTYRAIAIGVVEDGHPLQFFSGDATVIMAWARSTATAKHCKVKVHQTREVLIATVGND